MKITAANFDGKDGKKGFSLIEVVLAIGIFLVTILALVGLLGPTLKSVDDVEKTDEIVSVVNTVNAFLQSSKDIAPNGSKFDRIYNAVNDGNRADIFVFRAFRGTGSDIELKVGFAPGEVSPGSTIGPDAYIEPGDFENAAGPIYRVVLSPSSVIPESGTDFDGSPAQYRNPNRDDALGVYTLTTSGVDEYYEGYFAMEVRIFAREADMQAVTDAMPEPTLQELADEEPLFTYNTAVVR